MDVFQMLNISKANNLVAHKIVSLRNIFLILH